MQSIKQKRKPKKINTKNNSNNNKNNKNIIGKVNTEQNK